MEKKEKAEEATQTTFEAKVNKYAFIHLSSGIREAWGIQKGTEYPITIELTTEGSLTIRKA